MMLNEIILEKVCCLKLLENVNIVYSHMLIENKYKLLKVINDAGIEYQKIFNCDKRTYKTGVSVSEFQDSMSEHVKYSSPYNLETLISYVMKQLNYMFYHDGILWFNILDNVVDLVYSRVSINVSIYDVTLNTYKTEDASKVDMIIKNISEKTGIEIFKEDLNYSYMSSYYNVIKYTFVNIESYELKRFLRYHDSLSIADAITKEINDSNVSINVHMEYT